MAAGPFPLQANHNLAIANMFPSRQVAHTCPIMELGQEMLDRPAIINLIHLDEFHLDNQRVEDKLNSY